MTLHTQALEVWNREIAAAVAHLGKADFYTALVEAMAATLPVDYPQVWRYTLGTAEPTVLFHRLSGSKCRQQVEQYRSGECRHDPFYTLSHSDDLDAGFVHWRAATDTERVCLYDGQDVCDEVVFVAKVDARTRIHLCLMRSRTARYFSPAELALLRACSPMVVQLINQHVQLVQAARPSVEAGVRRAVSLFGQSLLTAREQDVLGLMLGGYATRFAADKLGISTETLRRHRKNIYQKLDVSSQSEVFSLFINSLGCFDAAPEQDPLRGYFGQPEQGR